MDIKLISLLCTAVFIYNDRLIDFCSSHNDRRYKCICVIPTAFPILYKANLFAITDNIRNRRCRNLFRRAIAVLYGCFCSLASQLDYTKSITFYFSADRFKEAHDVFSVFFTGCTVCNFFPCNFNHRAHLFQP